MVALPGLLHPRTVQPLSGTIANVIRRQELARKVWSCDSSVNFSGGTLEQRPLQSAQQGASEPDQRQFGRSLGRPMKPRGRRKLLQTVSASPGASFLQAASAWPAVAVVALTTLAFLAAAFICVLLLLKPVLKRVEALAVAAELAAKSLEKASAEFELASNVINTELPTTLDSVERASLEFEELGQSLNGLTGGLKRSKANGKQAGKSSKSASKGLNGSKPLQTSPASEWSPVGAIQEGTANSMRRVAQDVAALTAALTPAMVAWRKRISFITERFEAVSKDGRPALPEPTDSAGKGEAWVEEWKRHRDGTQDKEQSVGEVASDLAQAASEAAKVARRTLPVEEEDTEQTASTRRGADLLDKAAHAAVALTDEASQVGEEAEYAIGETAEGLDEAGDQASSSLPAAAINGLNGSEGGSTEGTSPMLVNSRREAAKAVFAALSKAEEAASAAATASGELESVLQQAEQEAGSSWWGWNPAGRTNSKRVIGSEPQEHDGMAYPSSPFIAATQSQDLEEEAADQPKQKAAAASSKR